MGKSPAFMFYVGDYMQDTRCLSLAARGAWVDCLCAMWHSQTRGEVTYPLVGYARLFGCTVEQAKAVIDELVEMQTCDCVTHDDGKVTVSNRRMRREAKERELANDRQLRYRKRQRGGIGDGKSDGEDGKSDGEDDGEVTAPSSYSHSNTNSLTDSNTHTHNARARDPAKSRYTRETCLDYVECLAESGVCVRNPGGLATTIYRNGEADPAIKQWVANGKKLPERKKVEHESVNTARLRKMAERWQREDAENRDDNPKIETRLRVAGNG